MAECAESLEAFRRVFGFQIRDGEGQGERAATLLNLVVAGGELAVAEVLAVGGAEEAVRELADDSAASPEAEALLRALEGAARRREHRLADFLNGLVQSDPYIASPSSASTHG